MVIRIIKSVLTPPRLSRPMALSSVGLPRYWATVYEITALSGLRDRTVKWCLLAIEAFYSMIEDLHGVDCLDQLLHRADVNALGVGLEAFFLHERNVAMQDLTDRHDRWTSVKAFVFWILETSSGPEHDLSHLRTKLHNLGNKLANLTPCPNRAKLSVVRALPSIVIQDLYEIFDPQGIRNPFRTEKQKWRNQCLFLTMLHEGIRRSEALLLPVDAVKNGRDHDSLGVRHWMNIQNEFQDEDPRYCDPPSIKNSQSVRQIPVSEDLAKHIQYFITNYRGRSPYPFLFLNSHGKPLGTRSVSNIMLAASSVLSVSARQSLSDNMQRPVISSHDLRHTCAVVRLFHYRKAGLAEEESLQKLRAYFGWTHQSIMPRHYARAYWERHVEEVWNDSFDAHVEALRNVEHMIGGKEA